MSTVLFTVVVTNVVLKMWQIFVILLDQSGVTGGGLDPYNIHALFVNMDNMHVDRNIWKSTIV